MKIDCVWEHNGKDTLLYAADLPGAYTRGESKEIALAKMDQEVRAYLRWCGKACPGLVEVEITQEKESVLQIRDADSDVLFDSERLPLTAEKYRKLKALVLKSAEDFLRLYESVPDKHLRGIPLRNTFYGSVPGTAEEMYSHTKSVNSYYFAEIDVEAENEGTILECRRRGFENLEKQPDFLSKPVAEGSYGEQWTLGKVMRRFLWHDRIHAKAMYRMAVKAFGEAGIENTFGF